VIIESNKDMSEKIRQYKEFIGMYVVEAQEHKAKAVRDAEARVAARYEEKLAALTAAVGEAAPPSVIDAVKAEPTSKIEAVFKENFVDKVEQATTTESVSHVELSEHVAAPKLAAPLADAEEPSVDARTITMAVVNDARRVRIVQEAAEGLSRWGDSEVNQAAAAPGSIGKQAPAVFAATPVDGATYPPCFIAGSNEANAFYEARRDLPAVTARGWFPAEPERVHKSGLHVFNNLNTDGTVVKT